MSRSVPLLLGFTTAAAIILALVLLVPLGAGGDREASGAVPSASPTPGRASPVATRTATPSRVPNASPATTPPIGIEVGNLAPDFALDAPDGRTVRLSDFRGSPVWVNFWAPWCPACRTEMPRIEGMYQEHRADGLVVLGVAVQDSREAIVAFVDEVGATYPIVSDGDSRVAAEYGALALPVHYWIDRDGIVRDWAFGELPPDLLAASLDRILIP